MVVIDASGLLLGRLSSIVAKQLLLGRRVVIVNSGEAVFSGRERNVLEAAERRLQRKTLGARRKGPKNPRRPEEILRQAVRGMLPLDKQSGRAAYRRLKVHVDIPEDLDERRILTLPEAKADEGSVVLTAKELAKKIGWNP